MDNKLGTMMESALSKLREMINADTVVGSPITTPDGVTVIPVSKVSYAFAGGGNDYTKQNKNGFGGGNGVGVKYEPIGFLICKDGNVRMINIAPPAATTIDRALEKAPDIIELVDGLITKYTKKDEN